MMKHISDHEKNFKQKEYTIRAINWRSSSGQMLLFRHAAMLQIIWTYLIIILPLFYCLCDIRYEKGTEKIVAIDEIIVHPKYNWKENLNRDIALLHMKKPVSFTDQIHPICLPTKQIVNTWDTTLSVDSYSDDFHLFNKHRSFYWSQKSKIHRWIVCT